MKKIIDLCLLCLLCWSVSAQIAPTCYRISLTDKNNTPYSIANPSEYLSPRAIAKRVRFNIPITSQDFPVNPQYLQQIKAVNSQIRVLCQSKWMNTVTIYCPDSNYLQNIRNLSFVSAILPVANYQLNGAKASVTVDESFAEPIISNWLRDSIVPYDYGSGYEQIAFHNGHFLHNLGFRGDSILIAVLDAGWNGVDTSAFFSSLFQNGQILGTRDLIPDSNNVFSGHSHGTIVTSTMAGCQEGILVGTAPNAHYFFIRTENPNSEELIEEDFWAQGAEIADSIGADVINSSLGYTTFTDFPEGDFTYADIDGVTSIASRAATILSGKGVVVCISAGNNGADEWHYISHPCDAFNVLAVGASDIYGNIASFSSRGPSYDGRVKPDITSVGVNTACMYPGDYLGAANGTSLAGPVAAGLCACLWQALPDKTSTELMQIIRESSSCYNNPNDSLGYGIPDFFEAYSAHSHDGVALYDVPTLEVFPNPCTDFLQIPNSNFQISRIDIFAPDGKIIKSVRNCQDFLIKLTVSDLPKGLYIGKAYLIGGRYKTFKMIK